MTQKTRRHRPPRPSSIDGWCCPIRLPARNQDRTGRSQGASGPRSGAVSSSWAAARAEVPVTAGCRPVPSAEWHTGLLRLSRPAWLGTQGKGDKGYDWKSCRWRRTGSSAACGPSAPACRGVPRQRGVGGRGSLVDRADRTAAGLPGLGRRTRLRIREPAPPAPRPRGTRPPAAGRVAAVPLHPDGGPAGARPPDAVLGRAGLVPGRAGRARLRVRRPLPEKPRARPSGPGCCVRSCPNRSGATGSPSSVPRSISAGWGRG